MRAIIATLGILFAAQGAAFAQEPAERLRPLAWIGGEWEGSGKYGNEEFTETTTYEWSHGKNFIKWSAEARMGDQVVHSETGMLGWDEAKGRLVSFSFSMDGTIGHAEDQAAEEKDTWVWLGNVGNTPPWHDTRQVMKRVDDDTFSIEVQTKHEGQYETFFNGSYTRKKKE